MEILIAIIVSAIATFFGLKWWDSRKGEKIDPLKIGEFLEENENCRDEIVDTAREVIWQATDNELIEMFDKNLNDWKKSKGLDE